MEQPTSANIHFPIFMVRVVRRFEGVTMRPCGRIQVGGLLANGRKQLYLEPYVDTMG